MFLQCHLHKAGISRLAGTTCSVMRNQTATVEQKAYFSLCSSILKQEERKITKVFNSFESSCTCELWRTLPFWENSEPARFCTANSVTNKSGASLYPVFFSAVDRLLENYVRVINLSVETHWLRKDWFIHPNSPITQCSNACFWQSIVNNLPNTDCSFAQYMWLFPYK